MIADLSIRTSYRTNYRAFASPVSLGGSEVDGLFGRIALRFMDFERILVFVDRDIRFRELFYNIDGKML